MRRCRHTGDDLRVYAGLRADPFFLDVQALLKSPIVWKPPGACIRLVWRSLGATHTPYIWCMNQDDRNNYNLFLRLVVAITQIGNNFGYPHRLHFSAWYYCCYAIY